MPVTQGPPAGQRRGHDREGENPHQGCEDDDVMCSGITKLCHQTGFLRYSCPGDGAAVRHNPPQLLVPTELRVEAVTDQGSAVRSRNFFFLQLDNFHLLLQFICHSGSNSR